MLGWAAAPPSVVAPARPCPGVCMHSRTHFTCRSPPAAYPATPSGRETQLPLPYLTQVGVDTVSASRCTVMQQRAVFMCGLYSCSVDGSRPAAVSPAHLPNQSPPRTLTPPPAVPPCPPPRPRWRCSRAPLGRLWWALPLLAAACSRRRRSPAPAPWAAPPPSTRPPPRWRGASAATAACWTRPSTCCRTIRRRQAHATRIAVQHHACVVGAASRGDLWLPLCASIMCISQPASQPAGSAPPPSPPAHRLE